MKVAIIEPRNTGSTYYTRNMPSAPRPFRRGGSREGRVPAVLRAGSSLPRGFLWGYKTPFLFRKRNGVLKCGKIVVRSYGSISI